MALSDERTIAVVDPVAAGASYGEEGSAMGLAVAGVLTRDFTVPYIARSFERWQYREIHRHRSIADTVAFLKDRRVSAVIPGASTAIEFVDVFADSIGAIGNPVESVGARANKRIMKEYWTAAGVPCAAFYE